MKPQFRKVTLVFHLIASLCGPAAADENQPPNIVLIYADDMGYGDVQALNPERGKIPTPHLDQLASEGMVFTDAHTTSSVCTPSRYGLLTGRYHWRTRLQKSVLWGYSEPLISEDTLTLGQLLRESGYETGMIGKWHLGMKLPTLDGKPIEDKRHLKKTAIDWDGEIMGGPADRGFDYFFGIAASLDMAPYIYIENRKFLGEVDNNNPPKPADGFERIEVLDELGRRSAEYVRKHQEGAPFFLYVPLTSPHTPILPTEEWQGKSGINKYADFQMQTDAVIGRIIEAVDQSASRDNTLIIVSSDNGCSKAAKITDLEAAGHYPSAQFRGSKADIWEGGHRVPFIVRWPAVVEPGTRSDEVICHTDCLATFADILDVEIPEDEGEDSVSFYPALEGREIVSERKGIVHHSISGHFAYRMGDWKLILAKGSGGWTAPTEKQMREDPEAPRGQLYNLADDPGERNNLFEERPELVAKLFEQLKTEVANGRCTPGAKQANDLPLEKIILWK